MDNEVLKMRDELRKRAQEMNTVADTLDRGLTLLSGGKATRSEIMRQAVSKSWYVCPQRCGIKHRAYHVHMKTKEGKQAVKEQKAA